jgi:hypothetical protein
MTIPNEHPTATDDQPGELYADLLRIVAELDAITEKQKQLLARRDTEMRRLRREHPTRTSVASLRHCTRLSKSSVRLITSERRGD